MQLLPDYIAYNGGELLGLGLLGQSMEEQE